MPMPETALAPPKRSLLDIAADIDELWRIIEDPDASLDGGAAAQLELDRLLSLDLAEKVDACAYSDKRIDMEIGAIKYHVIAAAKKAVGRLERRKEYFRARYREALNRMSATLTKGNLHSIFLRAAGEEVVYDDDCHIPEQYCRVTVTMPRAMWSVILRTWSKDDLDIGVPPSEVKIAVTVDETAVKRDLKAGKKIAGARLKPQPDILVIR